MKPYVKTNKSDYIDAEAIAEAVGRPTMRFVPIKSDDQLDLQSLHRVRPWVTRCTAVNQIWGLMLELGAFRGLWFYHQRVGVQASATTLTSITQHATNPATSASTFPDL